MNIHAMMLCLLLASAPGISAAGEPAGNAARPAEEAEVLATLDRYLAAVSADDQPAMAALQTADGMTYRVRAEEDGRWTIKSASNAYWVDPANKSSEVLRERYWSPTVHVRGAIASVWAPYEFWIDGKTSHCGIDVFDFIRTEDGWRVANAMWTVEPDACEELRPADASMLRPAG